jgi:precorrin-2 dehydrogenase/sirohydrochlorin ferrochelatase
MKYYPLNLSLRGKKCVVVGGGKVAERRILGLLECGANVAVISPTLTPKLKALLEKREITYLPRGYKPGDLVYPGDDRREKAYLVIASTDNHKVNRRVGEEAKSLGILVNVVSEPKLSDFTVPSVLRRGKLTVTISTSGDSPALSRRLRLELEKILGEEYEVFTELLGVVRKKLRTLSAGKRRRMYTQVATSSIPELLRDKKYEKAEEELKKITGLGFDEINYSPNTSCNK